MIVDKTIGIVFTLCFKYVEIIHGAGKMRNKFRNVTHSLRKRNCRNMFHSNHILTLFLFTS